MCPSELYDDGNRTIWEEITHVGWKRREANFLFVDVFCPNLRPPWRLDADSSGINGKNASRDNESSATFSCFPLYVLHVDWLVTIPFASRIFRWIPSHYSTFATPICLSQPLSGVACSNEWPWHHWGSTDWKWKDLGVSGTAAWALPGSICCCGCCMKFFFFANLTGCTMDACFPHQVFDTCNSQSNRFFFWRVSFLKKKSLSLHEYQIL